MIKPLVIFHSSCADGFGAAFAAWLKFGDEAEYVPMQYGKENEHFWLLEDGQFDSEFQILNREIYILDFSFSKWVMEGLFSLAKHVWWFDHHKSAFEMWLGRYEKGDVHICNRYGPTTRCEIILNDNKSGALLAWEYFHPGTEVPMLVRMIDDRDRWQFKIEGSKAFQKALWSYAPWSFKQWEQMWVDSWGFTHSSGLEGMDAFITEGEAILRAHDQNVQSVVKGSARKCELFFIDRDWNKVREFGIKEGLAANCPPHLTSDVGHELANQSGTFGLCWTLGQSGTVAKCSLRSNGEYDVSAIAKIFGGGGHRNAAGFEVDIQTLLGWLK